MAEPNIYVNGDGSGTNSGLATAALLSGGGMGMNAMWPLMMMYPWLFMGGYGGFGGFGGFGGAGGAAIAGQGLADINLSGQIQNLSNQISDNQNSTLTMGAINNVGTSVKDNGVALNAGFDTVNAGLCGVKSAILEQGAAINLGNCQQSNLILQQAQGLNNTVANGFTSLGYQLQTGLCDAKQNSTANTQRIIDTLNNKWQTDSAAIITQLRDELATLQQTQTIIANLGGAAAVKSATA